MKQRENGGTEKRSVEKEKEGVRERRVWARERERENSFPVSALEYSKQVLIKRIQKRGAHFFCVEMLERVILPSPPLCPAALQACFHILPLSCQAALVYLNIDRSHQVEGRERTKKDLTHFSLLSALLLASVSAQTLQAVFERERDQCYLYTY